MKTTNLETILKAPNLREAKDAIILFAHEEKEVTVAKLEARIKQLTHEKEELSKRLTLSDGQALIQTVAAILLAFAFYVMGVSGSPVAFWLTPLLFALALYILVFFRMWQNRTIVGVSQVIETSIPESTSRHSTPDQSDLPKLS